MNRYLLALLITALTPIGCKNKPVGSVTPTAPTVAPANPEEARSRALHSRSVLEKAAMASPEDPWPQLELALFDRMNGDLVSATRRLAEVTARNPKFARASYHLGLTLLRQGDLPRAVTHLGIAAKNAPEEPEVLTNAAVAFFRAGNLAQASRLTQAALKRDRHFPDAHLISARIRDEERKMGPALAHLKQYIALAPNPSPGFYLMGRIYARGADGKNAAIWLQKAAEVDPQNPEIHVALGRVYMELFGAMRMEDAIRSLKQAVTINPEHPVANYHLGRALMQAGRNEEAISSFQAALKTSPEPGPIHYDLGQTFLRLGRKDDAEKHLSSHRAFQNYTSTFNRLGREIDRNPRDPQLRLRLADYCLKERQQTAAELVLQEAIRAIPSAAASLYRKLARVYEQMGREDLATRARDAAYHREKARGG